MSLLSHEKVLIQVLHAMRSHISIYYLMRRYIRSQRNAIIHPICPITCDKAPMQH